MASKFLSLPLINRLGWLLIVVLCMGGFAGLANQVLAQRTDVFDRNILLAIKPIHTPWLNWLMIKVTYLGEPLVLLPIALILAVILLLLRRYSPAIILPIATLLTWQLNHWLKAIFSRPRPQLWERILDAGFYSFPSGHAMVSFLFYSLIGYFLAVRFPQFRWLIFSVSILLIIAIGFSRLYLGVHWLTDIIAGYMVSLVCAIASIFIGKLLEQRNN